MAQVFISYSRVDSGFVELFIRRLQRAFPDLKIWHDQAPHGLTGGGNWWDDILAAIAASEVFIYILSNEAVDSPYCQAEFAEARRLQKRIITVQARDRTELTDDLVDIQFVDMKDGVDSAEAFASLVAAVNLRLREAQKYRNARSLWKPATPKPHKEAPPVRSADAPNIETPLLKKPNVELEALRMQRNALRWQVFLGLAGLGVALLAGLITLIPWFAERADNINATQTAFALTPSSTPTPTLTSTAQNTPTPIATLDIVMIVASLDAQATIQAEFVQAQATAGARATEYVGGTQNANDQTATAAGWTHTPTPNITASIEAFRTEQAQTVTQAWNESWTDTPSPTRTFTAISTSTVTPTPTNTAPATSTITPTLSPEQMASTPQLSSSAWTRIERDFDGVTMVLVPAGCFEMGDENSGDAERPVHQQCFSQPFWIDQNEVTNDQFRLHQGVASAFSHWSGLNRPRETINWFEARDYCAIRDARLPTEREWEYAARGPQSFRYAWGNQWDGQNTAWSGNSNAQTANVDSYPLGESWVGTLNMTGNVGEWVSTSYGVDSNGNENVLPPDEYVFSYPYVEDDGRETDSDGLTYMRLVRGGSWRDETSDGFLTSRRVYLQPSYREDVIGFRCARSS